MHNRICLPHVAGLRVFWVAPAFRARGTSSFAAFFTRLTDLSYWLLCIVTVSFCKPVIAQSSVPANPVLFVHGITASGHVWRTMVDQLDRTGALTGGRLRVTSNPTDGSTPTLARCDWAGDWSIDFFHFKVTDPSWGVTDAAWNPLTWVGVPSTKRYFAIDFSSSVDLTLKEQARELKIVIDCIKAIVPTSQEVNLVAHSMGGLASRAYLQNMAGVGYAYANDVETLITMGTPHNGPAPSAPGIKWLASAPGIKTALTSLGVDGLLVSSSKGARLLTDTSRSGEINQLNAKTAASDPNKLPPTVKYHSIVGAGALGLDDGIVPVSSQLGMYDRLAAMPGSTNGNTKFFVQFSLRDCTETIVHSCEPKDPRIIDKVANILGAPQKVISATTEHKVDSAEISVRASVLVRSPP